MAFESLLPPAESSMTFPGEGCGPRVPRILSDGDEAKIKTEKIPGDSNETKKKKNQN